MDIGLLAQIFLFNFCYITLNTIRFMLTMKGYRFVAPLLSVVEIIIYVNGLNIVMNGLDNPLNLAAYAIGYGIGIAVGIRIEDWLALGYTMMTVMTSNRTSNLPIVLRDAGYGVTISHAEGRDGERMVLNVLTTRKRERELMGLVLQQDEKAFLYASDPKYIHGGFWSKRLKK